MSQEQKISNDVKNIQKEFYNFLISDYNLIDEVYYINDLDSIDFEFDNQLKILLNDNPVIGAIIYFKKEFIKSYSLSVFNEILIKDDYFYIIDSPNQQLIKTMPLKTANKINFSEFIIKSGKKNEIYLQHKKRKRIKLYTLSDIANYKQKGQEINE